ncbi:MAG TPA: hypothetical protein VN920_12040 [Pyrinomonadaceae bacterium]|nr:hypothetical protein [Pyrinomonadaceae bacterium]
MANQLTTHEIKERIRSVNRRLNETRGDPRNADRALWGALAVVSFAGVTGQSQDVHTDPETVLADLLSDLIHWCDAPIGGLEEAIDFESALERARNHYNEECDGAHEQVRAEGG